MSSEGSGPIDRSDVSCRVSVDERTREGSGPIDQSVVSRRVSVDERTKDEEAVARSGDSGDHGQAQDPWFSGEMEQMETKWLEQKLSHRSRSQNQNVEQAQGGAPFRFGRARSLQRLGSMRSTPNYWQSRSLRHSRRDVSMEEFLQLRAYADASMPWLKTVDAADPRSSISDSSIPETVVDTNDAVEYAVPPTGRSMSQSKEVNRCYQSLEYFCSLTHLAFFGIIGVLIRYGLQLLFADVLGVTRDGTDLYIDLPANMVGSFFMGWVGIVFKRDLSLFSEPLAVGFSTGLMGSITTFSAWNQKMVSLMTNGNVAPALLGFLLGMELAQVSLTVGVDTATAFKWAILQIQRHQINKGVNVISRPSPDNFHRRMVSLVIFLCVSILLWTAAAILMATSGKHKMLWLACMVAPPGVWARWHLARFNGRGLGTHLKWLPLGTLLANLLAASLMAVLSILLLVTQKNNAPVLIGGFQLGFLGCMSTVSTFVAEIYSMRRGGMKVKAYVYILGTCLPAFLFGILLYSVPAWTKGYVKW